MKAQHAPRFLWLGNHLALDFLNTQPVLRGEQVDLLPDASSVIAWGHEAKLIDRTAASRLARRLQAGGRASALVEQAHGLRAAVRALVDSPGRRAPRAKDLAVINGCLRLEGERRALACTRGGFERRLLPAEDPAALLLRSIAEAAASLLCEADPELIRRCGNPDCVLFFYDESRNHKRRWCSMELCGNRLKVAAHYQRQREQRS
jgi:predicted RNA-binding Zn ribbon-like protein